MIATAIARKSDDRPRIAGDELVLRVYGFPNDRRIVRLRAHKCTVGSGPRCTLRLQAPGVAALHCLIVRGPAGAVVRRWSPDTLLNQQAFADANLSPGDILNVGPVTIEILSTGANISRPPEDAQTDERENELRAELESQRRSLDEQHNRWESEQAESRRMLDEQQAEIDKLSDKLNQRQNELSERQTAVQDEHNSLAEQRGRWETEKAESRRKLDEERALLDQQKAELDKLRNEPAEKLDALRNEQNALAEQRDHWETEQAESRRMLDDERTQFDEQKAGLDKLGNELNEQLDALRNEQNALAEQRGRWETELTESRNKLDDERAQLDSQKAELEKQRNELAEQLARQNVTEGDKDGQDGHIGSQLKELEDRRKSLEQERLDWQAAQVQSQKNFDEQKALLAEQIAELDKQQASLADGRNDLQAEQNALAEQRNALESEREEYRRQLDKQNELPAEQELDKENELENERPVEEHAETPADAEPVDVTSADKMLGTEPRPAEEPENLEFQTPEDKAPVDLDEVFRRIGASFEKDEHDEESQPSEQQAEQPEVEYDPRDKPVATAENAATQGDLHEESVEDYMNRLMKRVRESSSETPAPAYTPPMFGRSTARESGEAGPAVSNDAPVSSATFPEPPRREPTQMPPRKSAPERDINLSALRELANLSAHSAISRYTHRRLTSSMYSKLLVMVVSLASTGVLLWMWRTMSGRQITFYSALASLLVAIYWGVQYALVSGRLMISKSGTIEWKSAAAFGKGSSKEETVKEKTEEKAEEKTDAPQTSEA